jgi:RNAse (barnase) inhibitor barstar
MTLVKLDTRRITDWDTFHDVFAEVFGFPDYYGRNMDAWIDCMTFLDIPPYEMTTIRAPAGDVVTLQLEHVKDFAARCPAQYDAIIECSAFVNFRKIDVGERAVLALSFRKSV